MTAISAPDFGLMLLVLGVAAWTVAVRDAFAAVIGFVAYGLLLALLWVRLGAVDVALTEAAIGSGLTGMLLLRAGARAKATQQTAAPPGKLLRPVAAVLCATIAAGLASLVLYPPGPAPSLAPVAAASLPATGLGNPVTAVLLAFRAFDTFLEKVVLLLALIGVWSLAADRHWGGAPTLPWPADRDGALTFLAKILPPVGIVVGLYVFWTGADHPGGAFQGGAILSAMWLLAMLGGVASVPPVEDAALRLALVAGAALFLATGLAGFWVADAFLAYPEGYAKALIIGIEAGMTLSVAATLALLVAGPPTRGVRR